VAVFPADLYARTPSAILELQRVAGNAAVAENLLARHAAEKVLKFGSKWLAKRTIKTVSKHIARHGRRIAERAIHSVFKSPKKIKNMIELTLKEATELTERRAQAVATEALEEGAIRITQQQTATPGKVRWLVQRTFGEEIGTRGERILRVILDQSGRVVTAFPADRLAGIAGISAAGAALLESSTADAAEQIQSYATEAAKREEELESKIDPMEFVPFIGDIYGGSLNVGEDEWIRQRDFYAAVVQDVIAQVEHHEQRSLGLSARREVEEFVRASIAAPYMVDDEGTE